MKNLTVQTYPQYLVETDLKTADLLLKLLDIITQFMDVSIFVDKHFIINLTLLETNRAKSCVRLESDVVHVTNVVKSYAITGFINTISLENFAELLKGVMNVMVGMKLKIRNKDEKHFVEVFFTKLPQKE